MSGLEGSWKRSALVVVGGGGISGGGGGGSGRSRELGTCIDP